MGYEFVYIPDRGDLIWLSFTPQAGHEQAGRRPALILSPRTYNEKTGLVRVCPITSHVKGYPFEIHLPEESIIKDVILADHVKSLDWRAREAEFIEKAPWQIIENTIARLKLLIE
ncbi:MAG: endoribonuclease MazF [bacterium]